MDCEHKKLKAVGDRLFCLECGKELPIEFLAGIAEKQDKPEEKKPRKRAAKKDKGE